MTDHDFFASIAVDISLNPLTSGAPARMGKYLSAGPAKLVKAGRRAANRDQSIAPILLRPLVHGIARLGIRDPHLIDRLNASLLDNIEIFKVRINENSYVLPLCHLLFFCAGAFSRLQRSNNSSSHAEDSRNPTRKLTAQKVKPCNKLLRNRIVIPSKNATELGKRACKASRHERRPVDKYVLNCPAHIRRSFAHLKIDQRKDEQFLIANMVRPCFSFALRNFGRMHVCFIRHASKVPDRNCRASTNNQRQPSYVERKSSYAHSEQSGDDRPCVPPNHAIFDTKLCARAESVPPFHSAPPSGLAGILPRLRRAWSICG